MIKISSQQIGHSLKSRGIFLHINGVDGFIDGIGYGPIVGAFSEWPVRVDERFDYLFAILKEVGIQCVFVPDVNLTSDVIHIRGILVPNIQRLEAVEEFREFSISLEWKDFSWKWTSAETCPK